MMNIKILHSFYETVPLKVRLLADTYVLQKAFLVAMNITSMEFIIINAILFYKKYIASKKRWRLMKNINKNLGGFMPRKMFEMEPLLSQL